ncbi:MgtC/SapB family protein [Candidatus Woesearchaeota archaeon]|nr:MgtC/SapB family protein [Candidatus Woesearchaeota archaeon]
MYFGPESWLVVKIILAAVLGGIIGWEREQHLGEPGVRTFALVSIGSAAFVLIGLTGLGVFAPGQSYDIGRIVGQIIVGIGFICAGVIWRERKGTPYGLTTAAGLWVTAAIGVSVGLELWVLAVTIVAIEFLLLKSKPFWQRLK